ncbi:ADP-ribose pyrophosphatase YjhB, NUDIX family [Streptomyces sp. 2131.1]|uniref:NUDIX domain-containing protein n=1 Tax=Streptomyces sp. 2131.1 TaxID=1855346 RepID=UPI000899B78C|nr:NUDIX hydrolase [Streptomyces sp. 2131.1]SEC76837.1 ADP-ribose pyrophosphatase YjhB, NUDIX family [Streptomyces sp. 2131.1]
MTTTQGVPALPIRVCAALVEGDLAAGGELCLIRRERPTGAQYSLPGGILHPDEQVPEALARELREELGLDVAALPGRPRLLWAQDQATTRPGRPGTFRRLHLIHLLAVDREVRAALPAAELDAEDRTRVVWVTLAEAAGLHLYPPVGPALGGLTGPAADVLLPPVTDRTYAWR